MDAMNLQSEYTGRRAPGEIKKNAVADIKCCNRPYNLMMSTHAKSVENLGFEVRSKQLEEV
jgi:hypothetical protein